MNDLKDQIKESYVDGLKSAVSKFEKSASFNSYMNNGKFREKFANKMVSLITKVRGDRKK